ncbi:MAG: sugar transferase [Planctomycetota bacterium]|jgi:lipopolysaccharide/colanic/teichoic acid biosynthesis glycosyltransferase
MKLIVIHNNPDKSASNGGGLLKMAVSGGPLADVVFEGLRRSAEWIDTGRLSSAGRMETVCLVPESWQVRPPSVRSMKIVSYAGRTKMCSDLNLHAGGRDWLVISNGRFVTRINNDLLEGILTGIDAHLVAVNAEPQLRAACEKVRPALHGKVAGFRRLYDDSAELASIPADWPHHLFIRTAIIERITPGAVLPESFSALLQTSRSKGLKCRAVKIAGSALDIETEDGLLGLCRMGVFAESCKSAMPIFGQTGKDGPNPQKTRLVGDVLLGENVRIDPDVVIAGPSIIGDRATIERGAVISSSIIGPEVCVEKDSFVRDSIMIGSPPRLVQGSPDFGGGASKRMCRGDAEFENLESVCGVFRNWKKFAYAGAFKRMADILFAIIILVLFAPIMPLIALAVKLTSPGPVFYKDKRQGRYGKHFDCLKFRTMRTGSDTIQEKLRVASQVDGPQFKIDNDPRITAVGRFLRNTYIDEIPQFFNVLFGQMSVVGPRPSPEAENTLCPSWRDARLSVRPGITGLWQIYRTRKSGQDFQEWIYYDIEYVRNISFRMDLRICFLTVKKLISSFISQF